MKKYRLIAAMMCSLMIILVGCGKKTEVLDETSTSEAEIQTEETSTTEPASEETTETAVPEVAPVIYEGIDMESTLPGREWVITFKGIIDTPRFVVFNDEINKKIIAENEQYVPFQKGDTLILYTPNAESVSKSKGLKIEESWGTSDYIEFKLDEDNLVRINPFTVSFYNENTEDCSIVLELVEE